MESISNILAGQPRAVARAISAVENGDPNARDIMRRIFPHTGNSLIIGITGAPGSGKSTLVDRLIDLYRDEGKSVGVIAVDPSSPFSGGAVLGDRIRMMRHSSDPGIFIRSMATRGHLGGLSRAAGEAAAIMDAAGMQVILIETVGVGQDEVEVVKLADLIVVILNPGAGDDIQTFKAGIMEIADVFVLNKADAPGIESLERYLSTMLELGGEENVTPPVVKTIAPSGEGIDRLKNVLDTVQANREPAIRKKRKKALIREMLIHSLKDIYFFRLETHISEHEMNDFVERVFSKELDPYSAAEEISRKMMRSE